MPTLLPAEEPPPGVAREFSTDFTIHTIPYSKIFSGGPPKDGIPAIDNPQFIPVAEADEWLGDLEPVIVFQEQAEMRIYPFQILTWHEIVNDTAGGRSSSPFAPCATRPLSLTPPLMGRHWTLALRGDCVLVTC